MADNEKKSGPPLPWIVLSGVLGLFAVGAPANIANKVADAIGKSEDKKPSLSSTILDDNPLRPLVEFYSTRLELESAQKLLGTPLHDHDCEFLIVTVPDPIDSPFGYAFDESIDAIQRAVEKKDGYTLDRAWLPWEFDRKNSQNPAKAGDPPTPPSRYTQPGLLLFRRNADQAKGLSKPGLLIVFLVGESPLGGIQKRAFTSAVEFMKLAKHPVKEPIRVVGPYFAGSQTSLEITLKDWWAGRQSTGLSFTAGIALPNLVIPNSKVEPNPQYAFHFISGNAASMRKSDFLAIAQPGRLEFSSTVVPTKLTLNALLYYLAKRDRAMTGEAVGNGEATLSPGRVAILTELNTSMGRQISGTGPIDGGMLMLRFPMHISRVKAELIQSFRKKDESTKLNAPTADVQIPSINDDIAGANFEGIPMQGSSTTAAANAQVMSEILTTVSKSRCRYVGIVASDVRDKLFLVRLIREYCPDVHVFLVGADLLLTHPEYRYYLRGVIVGSTYPLIPINQFWTNFNNSERIFFPSVATEGTYNALLMHLGLNDQLLEYRPPPFALEPHNDQANSRPPIWISMIAPSGNFVPLQVFPNYEDTTHVVQEYASAEVAEGEREKPMTLTYPGVVTPVMVALFLLWLLLFYRSWFVPSSPLSCYMLARTGTLDSMPQLLYRNLILGSQVILLAVALAIAGTHADATHFASTWDYPFLGLAILLFVGMTLAMVLPFPIVLWHALHKLEDSNSKEGHSFESLLWLGINMAIAGVVIGFTFTFLNRYANFTDATYRTLFFVRAVDLGTGLSPLMPLFLLSLAVGTWAWHQLKRITLAERFAIPIPFPVPDTQNESRWFDRACRIDRLLRKEVSETHFLTRHIGWTIVIALSVGGLATGLYFQSLVTMEGVVWDKLFFLGFCTVFALTVSSLVHLFLMWSLVKRLLDSIAMIPMMRAFGRLPTKIVEVFGKYLYTKKPHLRHLQLPIHQLRVLSTQAKNDPTAPAGLMAVAERYPKLDHVFLTHFAQGRRRKENELLARSIRSDMSEMAASTMETLADRWTTLDVDEAYGGGIDDYKVSTPAAGEPAWVHLAEGFAATQIVVYLSQYFLQLRNLASAVVITSSLLILAATSYPFHPQQLLLYTLLGLIGAGLGMVVYVFVEMNRDTVVSRISRTQPGKLSMDSGLVGSFMTYVLPAGGLLTAQLSGSFRWLFEPLLKVLK